MGYSQSHWQNQMKSAFLVTTMATAQALRLANLPVVVNRVQLQAQMLWIDTQGIMTGVGTVLCIAKFKNLVKAHVGQPMYVEQLPYSGPNFHIHHPIFHVFFIFYSPSPQATFSIYCRYRFSF